MLHSYPSIYNLGHAAIADLLKHPVIVEEKVDGSQISFGIDSGGAISVRSKGANINIIAPEGMFKAGVESILSRADKLKTGYVYRGEYLNKPHHNALTYSRIPNGHIIIFDVNDGLESYLSPEQKQNEAALIGLEFVPMLHRGMLDDAEKLRSMLETTSVLGGQKIEGVVIKPDGYQMFGRDKKVLMGKFVSEALKEVHSKTWDEEHKTKTGGDIIQILASCYGTPARWAKALIHMKEAGLTTGELRDIGLLMKEVPEDVNKECADEIKEKLMAWAWPQIKRKITHGIPEWYKEELMKQQFNQQPR